MFYQVLNQQSPQYYIKCFSSRFRILESVNSQIRLSLSTSQLFKKVLLEIKSQYYFGKRKLILHILIRCLILLITVCFAYSTQVGERRVDWLGLLLDLEREQRSLEGWNCPYPTVVARIKPHILGLQNVEKLKFVTKLPL